MNVADLDLCIALYRLTGWCDTEKAYISVDSDGVPYAADIELFNAIENEGKCREITWEIAGRDPEFYILPDAPAYELGYLQRKLRSYAEDYNMEGLSDISVSVNPENDYCALAIKLIEQGLEL